MPEEIRPPTAVAYDCRLRAEIVETAALAAGEPLPPLLVLDRVETFLDEHGLGEGPVRAERIGIAGGSNFTFLIERDAGRYVLRRPPRPPLPPSAHDMVREARLQLALARQGIRVPAIVAVCEDESVLGVPFYVMEYVEGHVVLETLPPHLERSEAARRALGLDLVDTLAEIHAVDVAAPDLHPFVRSGSYLERQVRRWQQLWGVNRTRELPVPELGRRMETSIPEPLPDTVVHGDYRIGNALVSHDEPRIAAVLDWELGAIGDPRADVGYLVATYAEPGGSATALGTSPATATAGFPSRAELVARYEERSGRRVERLGWFEALAMWKAAVFCEAIYGRYARGELGEAPQAARFEQGVPLMVEAAFGALERDACDD
ncbi:MAG: phosphotransferase family protein [Gaiellaceae bacterium]